MPSLPSFPGGPAGPCGPGGPAWPGGPASPRSPLSPLSPFAPQALRASAEDKTRRTKMDFRISTLDQRKARGNACLAFRFPGSLVHGPWSLPGREHQCVGLEKAVPRRQFELTVTRDASSTNPTPLPARTRGARSGYGSRTARTRLVQYKSNQAGGKQHQTGCGQRQKAVGEKVVIAHATPSIFDQCSSEFIKVFGIASFERVDA
jgi:hypothetical protein